MKSQGLHIERLFTGDLHDPFEHFKFENRKLAGIKPNEIIEVEVPKHWSDMAAHILATHYLVQLNTDGVHIQERSARQAISRMTGCWARWGFEQGYFASWEDALAFRDETAYMLLAQMAAPNSPQWFNTGIYTEYGIKGMPQGHFHADPDTGEVNLSKSSWEHPQLHACFIQSVRDNLVGEAGIMDLWLREARVFKFGSGTGSNFSTLRARGEKLEGGGTSSGLVSFLKVGDAAAGAIRSGGATRRAAKMVIVDIDHPDILEFIQWKAEEEDKADVLIKAGYTPEKAYATVSGQNANHSVRVTDAFMHCLDEQGEWALRNRTNGRLSAMPKATLLWSEIAKAAWRCGDPGIQFDGAINQWNTCPESGRIHASNPCAEYLFLDDTACNLASLNLLKFLDEKGELMVKSLKHASRIWTTVLEISVMMGQFPSAAIAKNTWRFRTLGLGITGLGSTLLQLEIPYGSATAQHWSASVMALITGEAYRTSAEIAEAKGPFDAYHENETAMHRVIHMHMAALHKIKPDAKNRTLIKEAMQSWHLAETGGRFYGFRNAQTTCIAPTGTISLLLDSETTGMEPYYAFEAVKNFAHGPKLQIAFPQALKKIRSLQVDHVVKPGNDIVAAEEEDAATCIHTLSNPEFLPVLVAAMPCPVCHAEALTMKAHIDMMAAMQPFVSGGISKTVNLPSSASIREVSDGYWYAYLSGLKSISIYRDGSKSLQPLKQADCCTMDH